MIEMEPMKIDRKTSVIVCFGPLTETSGYRPGVFFQVTIDPKLARGDYIRFDQRNNDEIHGWQRMDSITICEVMSYEEPEDGIEPIVMQAVKE